MNPRSGRVRKTLRSAAVLAAIAAWSGCSVEVRQCQTNADCTAGATCDLTSLSGYGICRPACGETACNATQNCVSGTCAVKPPAIGAATVTPNSTAGGWYPRDATGATKIPVAVATTDYGSSITSVVLTVAGQAIAGAFDGAGTSRFSVPTSVQAALRETPLPFTITVKDKLGNAVTAAPSNNAVLRIDNLGPAVVGLTVPNPDAVTSTFFFRQLDANGNDTLGPLDFQATLLDGGAGIDPASLKLVLRSDGTTRVDLPGAVTKDAGTNVWHFKIPRVSAQIALGRQGVIQFRVIANDLLGNPQQPDSTVTPAGTVMSGFDLGIDGQPPVLTLDLTAPGEYPAANAGCDATTANLVCGHDGGHFWRKGDDGWTMFFTGNDSIGSLGSNMDTSPGSATCAIAGQTTCTVAYNATNQHYEFAVRPSQLTYSSDANGEGTATVTITARDAVGNRASLVRQIKITRLRWMVPLPPSFGLVKTAPVLAPVGTKHFLLLGGNSLTGDTIGQISESGSFSKTGLAQSVGPILDNMAFSPSTQLLYVIQEGGQRMFAFSVGLTGIGGVAYLCDLGGGVKLSGSPAIIYDGVKERALVADSANHIVEALTGSNGNCGAFSTTPTQTVGIGTVAAPSTDGINVYVTYQGYGLAKVSFANSTFGTPKLQGPAFTGQVGPAAVVNNILYLGVNQTQTYRAYANDLTTPSLWSASGAGAMSDAILASPVLSGGLVFGAAGANDGNLRAFNATDGSLALAYNPTGGSRNALSPVAISGSATPVFYFSDGSGQLDAVVQSGSGTTGALAPNWGAGFKGQLALGTTDVSFSSYGTEPVIGSDGTLYFAATAASGANANAYAIMTDSGAGVAPNATNWPRVGFDNCNSNNSSLTNCQ